MHVVVAKRMERDIGGAGHASGQELMAMGEEDFRKYLANLERLHFDWLSTKVNELY